jgi:hypothetical protein
MSLHWHEDTPRLHRLVHGTYAVQVHVLGESDPSIGFSVSLITREHTGRKDVASLTWYISLKSRLLFALNKAESKSLNMYSSSCITVKQLLSDQT